MIDFDDSDYPVFYDSERFRQSIRENCDLEKAFDVYIDTFKDFIRFLDSWKLDLQHSKFEIDNGKDK